MADNVAVQLGTGTGTAVIAGDEISGAVYQRVKLVAGADGTAGADSSETTPFPVEAYPAGHGADYISGYGTATTTGATNCITAPGTGTYAYVTGVLIHNSSNVDTWVALLDGTTTKAVAPAPGKGGAAFPCFIKCSTGSNFQFAEGAVASAVYVAAWGFKSTV